MTSQSPASAEPITVAIDAEWNARLIPDLAKILETFKSDYLEYSAARLRAIVARVVELDAALAGEETRTRAAEADANTWMCRALDSEARATALLEALRECRSGWPDVGDPSHLGLLRRIDALLRTGASNDRK